MDSSGFDLDDANKYIRQTLAPVEGIFKEMEDYAKQHNIPIIKPEVGKLLAVLGNILKPSRILEIGTAIGYSAILMSKFVKPGGVIDTIDRNGVMIKTARLNIKRAGMDKIINVIAGDALEVLMCLEKRYHMIFIDASKGQYAEFLPECLRMLETGGLLVSDNVLYRGIVIDSSIVRRRDKTIAYRLKEYLEKLCRNKELETTILPVADGVSLSVKR